MTDDGRPVDWQPGAQCPAVDYRDKPHRRLQHASKSQDLLPLLSPRHWGVWVGLGVLSLLWLLPVRLRDRIAAAIGAVHYRWGRGHYRAARRNVRACFPEKSPEQIDTLLREHSATQWCVWLDLPALWFGSLAKLRARTAYSGLDLLRERAERQQPTILLVCHNVALEHAAHGLKSMLPMLGYYRRFKSPVLEWLFHRLRSRNGGYLAARNDPLIGLVRDMRSGWQLYQMIDEDLGPEHGVFAELFATDMCAVTGSGRLCRLAGAAAVPVYSGYNRKLHRYEVRILPALEHFPSEQDTALARQILQTLESLIQLSPAQFMWRQRLLHTRRNGADSVYLGIRSATD